jgi:peptidyl-Lys metalloendopeptidase
LQEIGALFILDFMPPKPLPIVSIAFSLFLGVSAVAKSQDLSIELAMERSSSQQGEAVSVKYTVTNNESRPVAVLKWNTPLEGLIGNPFVVLRDGTERKFFGIMVLRTDPIESDWAVIPPKGSLSATVDLAQGYDLTAAGEYQVRPRSGFHHVAFDNIPKVTLKGLRRHEARSNTVTFRMVGDAPPREPQASSGEGANLSFVGCSEGQMTTSTTGFNAMAKLAPVVSSTVGGWDCTAWGTSPPATAFFGTCDDITLRIAQTVTKYIANSVAQSVFIDCTQTNTCASGTSLCSNSNVVAFTCSGGSTTTVYLCAKFFTYPDVGTLDSKETIFYHEISHWWGTSDGAYGCKACMQLASTDPRTAVQTASNYMYFAAFLESGDPPSCGVEHIAGFGVLLVLTVQLAGRKLIRKKSFSGPRVSRH